MIRVANYRDKRNIMKQYPHTKPYLKRKGILYIDEEDSEYRGFAFVQKRNVVNETNLTEDLILVIEVFLEKDRNKGIASNLVKKIIDDAQENGVYQIVAYYQKNNTASHKLWIKNQFSVVEVLTVDSKSLGCIATYKIS